MSFRRTAPSRTARARRGAPAPRQPTAETLERRTLLSAGDLDRTFSGDGKLTVDFAGARDEANAVLVRPDGTIFAAGFATSPTRLEDFALARIDLRGRLVPSFGRLGKVTTDFGTIEAGTFDRAQGAAFTREGRILLVGYAGAVPGGDFGTAGPRFGLARYTPGGAPDREFGPSHDGAETTSFRGSTTSCWLRPTRPRRRTCSVARVSHYFRSVPP